MKALAPAVRDKSAIDNFIVLTVNIKNSATTVADAIGGTQGESNSEPQGDGVG